MINATRIYDTIIELENLRLLLYLFIYLFGRKSCDEFSQYPYNKSQH